MRPHPRRILIALPGLVVGLALASPACRRPADQGKLAPSPAPPDAMTRPAPPTEATARPAVVLAPPGRPPARVRVALARTEAQRARGLMYVQHLPLDEGMLFLFDTDDVHSFWMKNTLIPLDMIFIGSDLRVVGVVANAEPLTLDGRSVDRPSRYVLEVNGGWAAAHGVGPGTPVRFEHVPLAP